MAAALTYAPEAQPWTLILAGLPVAATALLLTALTVLRAQPQTFVGYPMHWGSLWLPALMAAIVIVVHEISPGISILALIAAAAPTLALVVMAARGEAALSRFRRHVTARLPTMANELWLFLAAAVMAAGVAALIRALPVWLPFTHFGGPQAAAVLIFMVALAVVGVHPVVGIALMATVLQPLQPDPTLMAMTFLSVWAIGVAASPLSGMNLALQGAYDVRPMEVLRANAPYAVAMLAVASSVLMLYAQSLD